MTFPLLWRIAALVVFAVAAWRDRNLVAGGLGLLTLALVWQALP